MRATSESLSRVTNLVAVVTAPSLNTARIRHVEVLALQPQLVLVVIITSTGGVSKMLATFERPVDPGLLTWAGEYFNERLVGLELGARMVQQRLAEHGLSAREFEFLERFAPAFSELASEGERRRCTWRAPRACWRLGRSARARTSTRWSDLLERRVALLRVLRTALAEPDVYVRIGRRTSARDALARVRRCGLRDAQAQARRGVGDRPGADGLRGGDSDRARGGARAVAVRRGRYAEK